MKALIQLSIRHEFGRASTHRKRMLNKISGHKQEIEADVFASVRLDKKKSTDNNHVQMLIDSRLLRMICGHDVEYFSVAGLNLLKAITI